MRFTNNEIVFLTSVSKGRVPLGVSYRMPQDGKRQEVVEETIQSLMKKGILNEERKLTEKGAVAIRFWEIYRNNPRHVIVNRIKVAVLGDGKLIAVEQKEDSYEVLCLESVVFMLEILKNAEYLCQGEQEAEKGKWQGIKPEEWGHEMETVEGCIPIAEYENGRLQSQKLFYWKEKQGYQMNLDRLRVRSLSPAAMRKQLFRILGGDGYERHNEYIKYDGL